MEVHMMGKLAFLLIVLSLSLNALAEKCSKAEAAKAVNDACAQVEKSGKDSLKALNTSRFCGDNYVWIQDSNVKMVQHPIKPKLNGTDLSTIKDDTNKFLFADFDKEAKKNADGGWVNYNWPKPNAEKSSPKTSFVKKCKGDLGWIAGSGVWLDDIK
jgi:signal transduction histidine kinase